MSQNRDMEYPPSTTYLADVGGGVGLVLDGDAAEEAGEDGGYKEVEEEGGDGGVHATEVRDGVDGGLKTERPSHPGAGDHAGGPPCEEGPGVQEAGEDAEGDGGEELCDPDAAKQLHLDGVGGGQLEDEEERAELDYQGDQLGLCGFLKRGHGAFAKGGAELAPEIAGEEVGGGDGHDGGGDKGSDGDGGEAEAGEPLGEHLEKEEGNDGAGLLRRDAGGDGDVAEQRDKAKEEAVGGEHGGVAANGVGAGGREDRGGGVGIEHEGDRRADGEGAVAEELIWREHG